MEAQKSESSGSGGKLARRDFLKWGGLATGGLLTGGTLLSLLWKLAQESEEPQKEGILPPEYLEKARVIEGKDKGGNLREVHIGIKVPAGLTIRSPISGLLSTSNFSTDYQKASIFSEKQKLEWSIFPAQFSQDSSLERKEINKNQPLGTTQDYPPFELSDGSTVNLLISVTDFDKKHAGFDYAISILKQHFPEAFKKPSIESPVPTAGGVL